MENVGSIVLWVELGCKNQEFDSWKKKICLTLPHGSPRDMKSLEWPFICTIHNSKTELIIADGHFGKNAKTEIQQILTFRYLELIEQSVYDSNI